MGTIAETLIQEGKQEGRREGRQEGAQVTFRNSILAVLRARFALSEAEEQWMVRHLAQIFDLSRLEELLNYALHDASSAEFGQRLE